MTTPQVFFLPAPGGQRLCVHHAAAQSPPRGNVLFLHAFGEEMNKSRRMAALQARALAADGYAVLQIDLAGCGDSSGDFGDAGWDDWLADAEAAAQWLLARHDAPLWLWGHRAGALLAVQAAARMPAPAHLLLWQPPASGKLLLQQFLRLKAAADMIDGGAKGVVEGLKQQLRAGQTVEIAGYRLSPALAQGLEAATMTPPPAADAPRQVVMLEVSSGEPPAALPATAALAERWQAAGWQTTLQAVAGPAFWQTVEIEDAPGLIEATRAALNNVDATSAHGAAPSRPPSGDGVDGDEQVVVLRCGGQTLPGIVTRPQGAAQDLGVVIVVGGPQYRAGSHRQFVLLARALAAAGFATLRFDVRGMGDAAGDWRGFESLDDDIAAAIDGLLAAQPGLRRVALWGLCDGASAALMYWESRRDPRVAGLALANPWVRSAATYARAQVKHYYLQRLGQREFWAKLLRGGVGFGAVGGLWRNARQAFGGAASPAGGQAAATRPFQQRMAQAWREFPGPLLLLLSGRDLTAREFVETTAVDPAWRGLLDRERLHRHDLDAADHTFSDAAAREQSERLTRQWLTTLVGPTAASTGARALALEERA